MSGRAAGAIDAGAGAILKNGKLGIWLFGDSNARIFIIGSVQKSVSTADYAPFP